MKQVKYLKQMKHLKQLKTNETFETIETNEIFETIETNEIFETLEQKMKQNWLKHGVSIFGLFKGNCFSFNKNEYIVKKISWLYLLINFI